MGQDARATERLAGDQVAITELAPDRVRVVVLEGPDKGREATLAGERLSIGCDPDCDLALTDSSVSRRHAELTRKDGGLIFADLGSTNGSFLGATRVQSAFVSPGTRLKLGRTLVLVAPCEDVVMVQASDETSFGALHGASLAMRRLFGVLARVAPTDITLLIGGETGTGKELAARAVHQRSRRAKGPFLPLDCGALDRELAGSDLFGHEPGAFTGAVGRRAGVFEQAKGGTVFLDEIGELPLDLQPKLLRVLEQREVRRLGSSSYVPVDVRVVAASHRNLKAMVEKATFREDLYYRIAQVRVELPPLRDRLEDLGLLVDRLLEAARASGTAASDLRGISKEALAVLESVSWKGNVRELRNVIDRAAALAQGEWLTPADLMLLADEAAAPAGASSLQGRTLDAIEKEAIAATLRLCGGNKTRAAKVLGIVPNTLREKMKKYGM